MYLFSYNNCNFYFKENHYPTNKQKNRVLVKCEICNNNYEPTLQGLIHSVDSYGKYVCNSCAKSLQYKKSQKFLSENPLPENSEILGPLSKAGLITKRTKIRIKCEDCNNIKEVSFDTYKNSIRKFNRFLCKRCSTKKTCIDKYGVENPRSAEIIKEKTKRTCLERYGTDCTLHAPEIKEKVEKTMIEKYGVKYAMQSPQIVKIREKNNLEKYGVKYPSSLEKTKEKTRQTCIERYGVNAPSQLNIFVEKAQQTYMNKYGVSNPMQLDEFKNKVKETCLKKYGVDSYTKTEDYKEKSRKTCQEKYGVDYSSQAEETKKHIKESNQKKYGVDCVFSSDEIKKKINAWRESHPDWKKSMVEKAKKTCMERYGVLNFTLTEEYRKTAKRKYEYKNMKFDSSWELAFFIYCEDHNIPIKREPFYINYFDLEGNTHRYYPDFIINYNEIIEIKGSHLYNEGKLKAMPGENQDLVNSKMQCMKDHDVKILSEDEIKKYINYVKDTYNKDYLKQFRI